MNTHGIAWIPLLIIIATVSLVGVVTYVVVGEINNPAHNSNTSQRACTEEAKLCPDGTAIGRSGPNCEFSACPNANTNGAVNANLNADKYARCRYYLPADCQDAQGYVYDPESGSCLAVGPSTGCSKPSFVTPEACEQQCASIHPLFGNSNADTAVTVPAD